MSVTTTTIQSLIPTILGLDLSSTSTYLPSLPTVIKSFVPTLQHIPKGARHCWAKALNACLSAIINNPANELLCTRLLMLPKCVLVRYSTES